MAVLGVSWSVGILKALIILFSLNMVQAGKGPMYCLSGKLRFVSQIIVRWPICEGNHYYFQFGDFFNGAQVGWMSSSLMFPIGDWHKLFLGRLSLISSYHLRKVCSFSFSFFFQIDVSIFSSEMVVTKWHCYDASSWTWWCRSRTLVVKNRKDVTSKLLFGNSSHPSYLVFFYSLLMTVILPMANQPISICMSLSRPRQLNTFISSDGRFVAISGNLW